MERTSRNGFLNLGTILAAVAASMCCILPVVVAVLGVGSAALGAKLEPYRPWMMLLSFGFLAFAFYREYRPRECEPGDACAVPANRRRQRIFLWVVAIAALILMAFPYYAEYLV